MSNRKTIYLCVNMYIYMCICRHTYMKIYFVYLHIYIYICEIYENPLRNIVRAVHHSVSEIRVRRSWNMHGPFSSVASFHVPLLLWASHHVGVILVLVMYFLKIPHGPWIQASFLSCCLTREAAIKGDFDYKLSGKKYWGVIMKIEIT